MTQPIIQTWIPKQKFSHLPPVKVLPNQDGKSVLRIRRQNGHDGTMPREMLENCYQLAEAQLPEAA